MSEVKQYLRAQQPEKLKKLFASAELKDTEQKILQYSFIDKNRRDWICLKLNIGRTKYHTIMNEALIKIEYVLKKVCV